MPAWPSSLLSPQGKPCVGAAPARSVASEQRITAIRAGDLWSGVGGKGLDCHVCSCEMSPCCCEVLLRWSRSTNRAHASPTLRQWTADAALHDFRRCQCIARGACARWYWSVGAGQRPARVSAPVSARRGTRSSRRKPAREQIGCRRGRDVHGVSNGRKLVARGAIGELTVGRTRRTTGASVDRALASELSPLPWVSRMAGGADSPGRMELREEPERGCDRAL